jgi:hypothetical protein
MLIKKKQLTSLNDEHPEKKSTRIMVPKNENLIEEKKCTMSHYPQVNTKNFTDWPSLHFFVKGHLG